MPRRWFQPCSMMPANTLNIVPRWNALWSLLVTDSQRRIRRTQPGHPANSFMDTPEINQPADNTPNDLRTELEGLRQLIISVLILMLIISGTFNIFLARQWKYSRDD